MEDEVKEQLCKRAPAVITRKAKASGALAAYTLADLQSPKPKLKDKLCRRHSWREARYSRHCTRCGLVEDKP
jgi:hypothetical protein